MSLTREQMIKGLDSLTALVQEQDALRRDGLIFIFEKGLWDEFMKQHCENSVKPEGEK